MPNYEYKVIPAPKKGERAKGVKGNEARFAQTLMNVMNEYGSDGWEYQRTDTLPLETRSGLTGKTTTYQNLLVFRRALPETHTGTATQPTQPIVAPVIASTEDEHDTPVIQLATSEHTERLEHIPTIGPAHSDVDEVAQR
ncbi:DUF4177 domain-containing protein [Cochlodiniinecator piscidefendens]|uniref:DUF4177 domain-containing protein n=1 Tax=Cochlodiniinecator piscidefendens TaxID=2715756 RepID=UPI00140D7179|nr:DUF4177 domain-containing protein [Cochlodiniinecator piscidefendens]